VQLSSAPRKSRDPIATATSLREYQAATNGQSVAAIEAVLESVHGEQTLNAYITETPDLARKQARESDQRLTREKPRKLEGVPLAVKDNFCIDGVRTTAGSRLLANFIPTYSAFVYQRVLKAGALCLGKTNMDEFGMGSSTENSYFGPTLNPRGIELGRYNISPGGSSGGAAAAVAAHLCMGALATDTGGSIRQPAAFCGVVGMKPTYGLCSRWGVVAYASSLDQPGVIARTVEDVGILIDVIVGEDPRDSTSVATKPLNIEAFLNQPSPRYKIGIPLSFRELSINTDLENCWKVSEAIVKDAGYQIEYVELPSIKYALPTYYIIALSEASSNLARYDGVRYGYRSPNAENIIDLYENTRGEGFGWEAKKRIIMGTFALSTGYYAAYYEKACRVRRLISSELRRVLSNVDCLIWPTAPTPAFEFGSHASDPLSMYLEDIFTVPINLGGLPAISLPISIAQNRLPMAIQVIGSPFGDANVFRVAKEIETRAGKFGLVSLDTIRNNRRQH
jgi:aspartyl-tRNA(Asn)/glutamyl-tRNA(Gln) amidotransferase subunit A